MINFRFIIPVYNSEKYIEKCLDSVLNQDYPNWKAFVVNDASADNTASIINEFVKKDKRFNSVCNFKNMGALWNCFNYIPQLCKDPEDIILFLDGDDWLSDSSVLDYLKTTYDTPGLWLSYGEYKTVSNNFVGCSRPLYDTSTYREKGNWCTSHLKTVKYWIWKKSRVVDSKDINGDFNTSSAWDHPISFGLLEMATVKHIKCIDRILYVYNNLNPISEDKKDLERQEQSALLARKLPKYEPVEKD